MAKLFFPHAPSPRSANSHLTPYQLPTNSLPTPTTVGFGRLFIGLKKAVLTIVNNIQCIFTGVSKYGQFTVKRYSSRAVHCRLWKGAGAGGEYF